MSAYSDFVRTIYFTGPLEGENSWATAEEAAAARELIRSLHYRLLDLRKGVGDKLPEDQFKRLEGELARRQVAAKQGLIRALQCSDQELQNIAPSAFETIPELLVLEDRIEG